jgi:hypothetical protein
MAGINDMTQLFLLPFDGTTLLDALTEGGESQTYTSTERPGERPTLWDDGLPVLEVVEDHAGWSLVALCPIIEDIASLSAFVEGRDGPATVRELEIAGDAAGDVIEHMGAFAACRVKGKWRPIDENARPAWSQHLKDCNTQKLRFEAQSARAANDDAAATAKAA